MVTVSWFSFRCRTFISVCNQPPKANSAFHPYGVGKWLPASDGKAKGSMVHSASGWTRGVQIKLWDPLRTRAIPERLNKGVFMTRRYTNPRLPYFSLPYLSPAQSIGGGSGWVVRVIRRYTRGRGFKSCWCQQAWNYLWILTIFWVYLLFNMRAVSLFLFVYYLLRHWGKPSSRIILAAYCICIRA